MDKELLTSFRGILREELKPIKQDVSGLKQDMNGVKQDIDGIKSQQWEDHEIIIALKHASEEDGAKIDSLKWSMAYVEGRLTGIEEKCVGTEKRLTNIESDVKEIKTEITDIQDAQREFYEMYGEQETKIRIMQRKLSGS